MKYFIKIYGCQYNEWDGARLDYLLQKLGLESSPKEEADVIFLLSCSVRKSAVDRAMGLANNNSHKKVVVTGCILENDRPTYLKKNVVIWDNRKPEELMHILFEADNKAVENFSLHSEDIKKMLNGGNTSSSYLPIMIGCNNFCSYCAVPYTRGREISRPFDEVVFDFQKMIEAGKREIMLLGQNVNSYNPNHESRITNYEKYKNPFAQLLEVLNHIDGDFTISFTSNHPKDMSDEVIEAIRALPKVKKEIHLPVQSGSNKILRAMNRPYTKETYLKLIERIRKIIPNISITTDFIVGFPGETEEDFQETVDLLKKVDYKAAYINKYSPRSGTAAYKLGDPISWAEKERRWRILNDISYTSKKQ